MSPRLWRWRLPLLLLLCGALFVSVCGFGFLDWDDDQLLTQNGWVQIKQLSEIVRVWDPTPARQSLVLEYFPLRDSVYALFHWLVGLSPALYHGFNLLLHLLNVALVYWLGRALFAREDQTGTMAWIAASLFAFHPIHVEVVAWVSALKELLMTCFVLLGALCYLRLLPQDKDGAKEGTSGAGEGTSGTEEASLGAASSGADVPPAPLWPWALGTCVCVLLACVSKHVGVTIAGFFAMFWLVALLRRPAASLWRWPLGLALGGLGWGLLYGMWSLQIGKGHLQIREATSKMTFLLSQPLVQLDNVSRLLWPFGYKPMYDGPQVAPWAPVWWLALVLCTAVFGLLAWSLWQRWWVPVWALGWGLVGVAPFALFQVGDQWTADRYLYLPSVGFCWLLAWCLWSLGKAVSIRISLGFFAGVLLLYSAGTLSYLPMWRSPATFWEGFVSRAPQQKHALRGLASYQMSQRRYKEALETFQRFLKVHPPTASIAADRTISYLQTGQYPQAIRHIKRSLKRFPRSARVQNAAGFLAARGGQPQMALGYFSRALQLDKRLYQAHLNLLRALFQLGRTHDAMRHVRQLRRRPLPAHVQQELHHLLLQAKRIQQQRSQR